MMNKKIIPFAFLLSTIHAFSLTKTTTTITINSGRIKGSSSISSSSGCHYDHTAMIHLPSRTAPTPTSLFSTSPSDDESKENNEEGQSLAADFFKTLQSRNIQLDENDLLDDDDDDEDDDEENDSIANVESGDDDNGKGTLSDNQVYSELNERVLETAGGFVDLVSGSNDDEDDDDESLLSSSSKPKPYEAPTTVPDPALTAGEVVMTVLSALNNNDTPTPDRGIEILFGYSASGSAISQAIEVEGMTPAEYATFLKEEYEYKILFSHKEVMIEKGDYSFDRKKAFYTARLSSFDGSDFTNVNFILSTDGQDEDDCWLVDSLLIRPEGMRRRRRR